MEKTKEKKPSRIKALAGRISAFFGGVKTEGKKIIWPEGKDALVELAVVVISAAVLSCVIAALDSVIQLLINLISTL